MLSIITNFGCHYTCPYCIVKNNGLQIPRTTLEGLDGLDKAIKDCGANWVSISGGGDPLFNVVEHKDWYDRFITITDMNHCKREMHTSMISAAYQYADKFDRVVYHLIDIEDIGRISRVHKEIVRVVFVVTEGFTPEYIDQIVAAVKANPNIDELSFRQMVDSNYQTTYYCYNYLKAGHKKDWWYIEQNDYNLYYAENRVYTEYKQIGCVGRADDCARLEGE